jgi:hypothetical protein
MGPEYEWLISDHPLALAERQRRASEFYAAEFDEEAALDEEAHQHDDDDFAGLRPGIGDEVGGLATTIAPAPDRDQLRYTAADAEPDEITVAQSRRDYQEYRRSHGEPDYVYPARYVGASAADHPPPSP